MALTISLTTVVFFFFFFPFPPPPFGRPGISDFSHPIKMVHRGPLATRCQVSRGALALHGLLDEMR
jgi:hypothetical protein